MGNFGGQIIISKQNFCMKMLTDKHAINVKTNVYKKASFAVSESSSRKSGMQAITAKLHIKIAETRKKIGVLNFFFISLLYVRICPMLINY